MNAVIDVPPEAAAGLKERSLASAFWLVLQNGLAALLLVAIPAVLAHLLTPEDLGLLEISLAFFGVATLFTELGTGPAIIQRRDVDASFLATVFSVNLTTGVVFGGVLVATAPFIAAWLRMDERLITILRCLGLMLLPLSTAIVPRNLLARRLHYRRITAADVTAGGCGALAGLVLVRHGLSWALIGGFATYACVVTAVLWTGVRWWPSARPDVRAVGPLLRFSLSVSGSKTLENLLLQSDRFLIGRYLGAASLGLFGLARTIVRVPLRFLLNVSDEILLPGLASLQSDQRLAREYYLTAIRAELAALGPFVIFGAVFATEISRLLFGAEWDRAAVIAQLLAFAAWRHVTGHTAGAVLLSHGRADSQLRMSLYSLILWIAYFFIGRPWGLEGVALSQGVLEIAGWGVRHTMANRVIGLGWKPFARSLMPLWIAHALLLVFMIGIRRWALLTATGNVELLAIGAVATAIAYAVIMRLTIPGLLGSLRRAAKASAAHAITAQTSPTSPR